MSNADRTTRFNDKILRKKVFGKTEMYFDGLLHDKELANICCGEQGGCKNYEVDGPDKTPPGKCPCKDKLTSTKLVVLGGLGPLTRKGSYNPTEHRIEISEGLLLKEKTEQGIEAVLQHELGHACQWCQDSGVGAILNKACGLSFIAKSMSENQLDETVGTETRKCIVTALEDAGKKREQTGEGKYCMSSWEREAFADAAFMPRWTSMSHWASYCAGRNDFGHASPRSYMQCLLTHPRLAKTFCSATGVCPKN